jgi:hypothetical protein
MMMENPYLPENMQKEFLRLREEIEQIEATSPRKERDERFASLPPSELERYKNDILLHEGGLFDKRQTLASLARAIKRMTPR